MVNKKCQLFGMLLAGLFLLLQTQPSGAEAICGKVRPLKPVRCLCGRLIDPIGDPISGATIEVTKDGIGLATVKTDGKGNFIFDELKPGSYELDAHSDGFRPFRSPIVVAKPAKQCRRGLVIQLVLSYPDNCGSLVVGTTTGIFVSRNSN
jgi:hypothetical protein